MRSSLKISYIPEQNEESLMARKWVEGERASIALGSRNVVLQKP